MLPTLVDKESSVVEIGVSTGDEDTTEEKVINGIVEVSKAEEEAVSVPKASLLVDSAGGL